MKRHAPATARNVGPLTNVLARELPGSGTVLEIASGTGEHALAFAERFPALRWLPSDCDPANLASIEAYRQEASLPNIAPPVLLDAGADRWPVSAADALLCVNMVHIAPWRATEGLFAGAARLLRSDAPLIVYGPFIESAVETAPSNLAFDRSLSQRDARWGLRDAAALDALGIDAGFRRSARYAMPANNIVLVWRRVPA